MTTYAGSTMKLRVAREVSPFGYFLSLGDAEDSEVLLHYSETNGVKIKEGMEVEAFLFHDTDDRLSATLKKPLIGLGELKRLAVADIHPRLGCFLEIGLGRQLLLPVSELPELIDLRPLPGDEVFVTLTHDKSGRLLAKLAREEDLAKHVFAAPGAWKNEWKEGWVSRTLQMGSFVVLDGGVVGFGAYGMIPAAERPEPLRLGQRVSARVTFVREDGRVNLSMGKLKQVGRIEDADRLLDFIKERPGGAMPYSDETPAELIKNKFGISKSAFKRAVGKLMRDGLVRQEGSWTKLLTEEEAAAFQTESAKAATAKAEAERAAAQAAKAEARTRAGAAQAEAAKPGASSAARPNAGRTHGGMQKATGAGAEAPKAPRPDAAQPNVSRPDAARPSVSRPGTARPDASRPDAARQNASRPNAGRPDAPRMNEARPARSGPKDGGAGKRPPGSPKRGR
ncbi:CvfB family protein [Paenibacillus albicereus]|uniref:CvfB family protein n=1 Tax=Paenibacillus albicereus TaxID=2726185 RepID=UPI001980F711|nr:S1-like domain-containing RNA-binding protein [Paenibacillus albicereus]